MELLFHFLILAVIEALITESPSTIAGIRHIIFCCVGLHFTGKVGKPAVMMDKVLVSRFQWFKVNELFVEMANDLLIILSTFDSLFRLHVKIEKTIETSFDLMVNTLQLFLLPGNLLQRNNFLLLFHNYYSS